MTRGAQRETVAMKTSKFRGSFDRREQARVCSVCTPPANFICPLVLLECPRDALDSPGTSRSRRDQRRMCDRT